jgi:hypothetical protein
MPTNESTIPRKIAVVGKGTSASGGDDAKPHENVERQRTRFFDGQLHQPRVFVGSNLTYLEQLVGIDDDFHGENLAKSWRVDLCLAAIYPPLQKSPKIIELRMKHGRAQMPYLCFIREIPWPNPPVADADGSPRVFTQRIKKTGPERLINEATSRNELMPRV